MTRREFQRLFPNATESAIAANVTEDGLTSPAEVLPSESAQQEAALDRHDAGEAQGTGRPVVRITMRRAKLLDEDAKHGACKDIVDGLRYASLLHSDAAGQFTLEVEQERVKHKSEQETLITITYR